jgi:repressor LexA
MRPHELATLRRRELGLTQGELAHKLKTTRVSIARYENGTRRIPGAIELLVKQLCRSGALPMAGIVAAGRPIEAIEQNESVEVPASMLQNRESFVLKISGESMRDDGILPEDLVVVRRQTIAEAGDRIIALVNGRATIKRYYPKRDSIELRPVNRDMEPLVVKRTDDFQIQGVVVGLLRYYR